MDFYGFYTGKIFDAYKYLGAHVEEKGVTFRTFAPSASRITLIGEFNDWQEWEMNKNGCIPWYKYKEASYTSTWYLKESNTIYQNFPLGYNYSKLKYHCYLKLLDSLPVFCGFGVSIREARMAACKLAYEYLERNDMLPSIRDEIENPNRDDAINQLETLARRGYFSIPTYEFKEIYDNNGNPIWNCECRIAEEDYYFDGTSSSKKEAKKDSAFRMLFYVLGMEDE